MNYLSWNNLMFTVMSVNLLAAIYLFYMLAFPVQLDVIHNEPFPVYPTEIKKGEEIFWEVEYSKTNNFPATINRNIICEDGNLITLASDEVNAPQAVRKIAKGSAFIPNKTSLGKCYVELAATYHINPLRNETKSYKTTTFNVIE